MTLPASQTENPQTINTGSPNASMHSASGMRHKAEIFMGNALFRLGGKLESASKWWIMAMLWSLFIGGGGILLAAIYIWKTF